MNSGLIEALFWFLCFLKQLKGNATFKFGNPDSKKHYEESSRWPYESSLSSQSCDESLSTLPNNIDKSGIKASLDQESDDSDSEIFRVKRRTSMKVDRRDMNDVMCTKHSDHQVHFVDFFISDAWIGCFNILILGTLT